MKSRILFAIAAVAALAFAADAQAGCNCVQQFNSGYVVQQQLVQPVYVQQFRAQRFRQRQRFVQQPIIQQNVAPQTIIEQRNGFFGIGGGTRIITR